MNSKFETILSEDFKKILECEKNNIITARSSKLQPRVVNEILKKIIENFKLNSDEEAITVLAVLFQQGGTARGCDGNMNIHIFNQDIKLSQIRKILKENSCNRGERKLARSLANDIYTICKYLELPGNLYNKIQKKDLSREFDIEEKAWLSDFQSDNEDCPAEFRELILDTFKTESSKKSK